MTNKQRAAQVVAILKECYPDAECALRYEGQGWRLLVLGMLSAQCTDRRVNEVAIPLFARYPSPEALAAAEPAELEQIIRPCGLYRTKAKNIKEACRLLCERHGGVVPVEMDALLVLPGVGRKIANLLRGDLYRLPAIVADTHCIRIAARLGFVDKDCRDPVRVERALAAVVAPDEQADFCHRIVQFGRDVCSARAPKCDGCVLKGACKNAGGAF